MSARVFVPADAAAVSVGADEVAAAFESAGAQVVRTGSRGMLWMEPLVELDTATREAKARVHALRAQPDVRAAKAAIVARHGSRRRPDAPRRGKRPPAAQLALDL